jgi:hypothetical protein
VEQGGVIRIRVTDMKDPYITAESIRGVDGKWRRFFKMFGMFVTQDFYLVMTKFAGYSVVVADRFTIDRSTT